METQCQHLKITQHNELLKLVHKFEELVDRTLVTWKTDPVESELKKMCSQYGRDHIHYQRYTQNCSKRRLKF